MRTLKVLLGLFVGLVLLVFLFAHFIAVPKVHELFVAPTYDKIANDLRAWLPKFRDDQVALSSHVVFAPHDGPDASELLAAASQDEALTAMRGEKWVHADISALGAIDTSFMRELHRYGSWNWAATAEPPPQGPMGLIERSLPDYARLHQLARLHLRRDPHARHDVLHLARLIAATETLIGTMTAVSILMDVDPEVYAQAKRAGFAYPGFLTIAAPDDVFNEAVAHEDWRAGRCGGIHEALTWALLERALLKDAMPQRYAAYDRLLASTSCRLPDVRAAWAADDDRVGVIPADLRVVCAFGDGAKREECSKPAIPLGPFRAIVGEILVTIGTPSFGTLYRDGPSP